MRSTGKRILPRLAIYFYLNARLTMTFATINGIVASYMVLTSFYKYKISEVIL